MSTNNIINETDTLIALRHPNPFENVYNFVHSLPEEVLRAIFKARSVDHYMIPKRDLIKIIASYHRSCRNLQVDDTESIHVMIACLKEYYEQRDRTAD